MDVDVTQFILKSKVTILIPPKTLKRFTVLWFLRSLSFKTRHQLKPAVTMIMYVNVIYELSNGTQNLVVVTSNAIIIETVAVTLQYWSHRFPNDAVISSVVVNLSVGCINFSILLHKLLLKLTFSVLYL